ncbi:hypothetical protein [Streptomyces sp. NPDC005573]|uniref:hypothetical protein n=1 Tax=Streptomyces sp. NPDC005573 TaxID=3156890 RepID=UPI0033BECFBA
MPTRPRLLSLGDRVRFDGREHTVAALHGTSVRLVDDAQAASVVLLGHLLASEGFAVLSTGPSRPPLPEEGVLDGLPGEVVERARWWQRHLTGLMTGRVDGEPNTPVRAEYDPEVRSVRQRELAKLAELRQGGEDNRTYDARELGPCRRQPSGAGPDGSGRSTTTPTTSPASGGATSAAKDGSPRPGATCGLARSRWVNWSSTGPTRCWPNALAVGRTRRKSRSLLLSCWTARPTVPRAGP